MEVKQFIDKKIDEIKNSIKGEKAISALSGGVDSSVATLLVHKAIGDNLNVVFIDTGLMRENEYEEVKNAFEKLGIHVGLIDAKDKFFKALKGVEDPEAKRKVFRDVFYSILSSIAKETDIKNLVQGTIAADILETKNAVKTQHNVLEQVGINPNTYGFNVIEPLKELYKHEVRMVAKEIGLPDSICKRQPFPGPGLAVRIVGEVTPKRVEVARKASKIVEDEIKDLNPFQAFAVLLNDKATGVKEGKRVFGDIVVVRSVDSTDALTATVTKIPFEILERIQQRITAEIPSVVKVLFDITPKPPSTIEYV